MRNVSFDLRAYLERKKKDVESALDRYLPGEEVYLSYLGMVRVLLF